jgi:hypothetical protein
MRSMETPVEIRYAGVVVARATEVLTAAGNESGMFLVLPDPLPVGTLVTVGEGKHARVEKVVESGDPHASGFYVRFIDESEVGARWVPSLPEMVPLPAPRRPSAPVAPLSTSESRPELAERRPSIVMAVPPQVEPVRAPPPPTPLAAVPVARIPTPASGIPPRPERRTPMVSPLPPPPEPVVERRRSNTLVSAVPPPAEVIGVPLSIPAEASGEIRSRGDRSGRLDVRATSSIVVEEEDTTPPPGEGVVLEEAAVSRTGEVGEPPPARPLPPPDGRRKTARKRRNTQR